MLGTRIEGLRARYRKTAPDLLALARGRYPGFVTSDVPEIEGEIVVFTFHDVEVETFEAQLAHLARNGYRTLRGEELRRSLTGEAPVPPRSIVLTFDDGLASLYTVAHPLLVRHGFRALAFLVSGCVPERPDGGPLCSWEEIREMHAAGSVELHSHSHHHDRVPVSPRVVDFLNPGFDASFAGTKVPALHAAGIPSFERPLVWGTPVHRAEPRMTGRAPYLDDEEARRACQRHVAEHGGEAFFSRDGWRSELLAVHRAALRPGAAPRYATRQQVETAIEQDLRRSRDTICAHVPGAEADQLCFPWYAGSDLALEIAARVGFRVVHWGIRPDRRTNRPGDDPLRVARVDERYLLRLPGDGRRPLREILAQQLFGGLRRASA